MKICFCRVDNRLLHGQVTNAWTSKYKIKHIFVVDDELYKDDIARRVLMLASPVGVNTGVCSIDQMMGILQQEEVRQNDAKAAILLKTVEDARRLFRKTGKVTDVLVLGGISCGIGRRKVCERLFLSDDEKEAVKDIAGRYNIRVEHQILPGDPPIDVVRCLENNG
ncbi:MAG: PTS sugar transporter subunit IIB [Dorea sp.]|nr:PTS sugar transporter subunit IIB [Dorea sp.]